VIKAVLTPDVSKRPAALQVLFATDDTPRKPDPTIGIIANNADAKRPETGYKPGTPLSV
jgi:hypothetical protein